MSSPSYGGITKELLLRYDRPGPRYTSYPTAPVWSEAFGEEDWNAALARADRRPEAPFSLYVHVPFCRTMCFYCGCNVLITRRREKVTAYVDRVLAEARLLAERLPNRRTVRQHHWGGGTPTHLEPEEIARLFTGITELFPLHPEAEVGIEVDPRVTTAAQLDVLADLGFNRISLGVQDFTPEVQTAIHRVQSVEETKALIDGARARGFESVNVDLVYGLPRQRPETFERTLDLVIDWGVDRVACYSFAYVPWLKRHQRALPEEDLPSPETKFALLALALEKFSGAGYVAIGFDHFARPGDGLARAARERRLHRNFMGYTTRMEPGRGGEDMLMLGITSIGEVAGAFGQNHKDVRAWSAAVDSGHLPIHRGHLRTPDDEERRRIILDLMCDYRVDFAAYDAPGRPPFAERYAAALAALAPLARDGLVEIHSDALVVTQVGRIFLRNVCMPFDAYLEAQLSEGRARFSRTV